jgi:hypothetical protein
MSSSSDRNRPGRRVVNAFLSHSYGAPAVNLFFHELTSTAVTITFRVDRGKFSTSTTRSTFAVMLRRGPRLAGLPGFLRLLLVGGMWGEIGLR